MPRKVNQTKTDFFFAAQVEQEKLDNNPAAYAERENWDAFDPNLVSEGLFAAANIFSTLKLVYIFTVNPHLGPLQITLGRMVMDIMKYVFFFLNGHNLPLLPEKFTTYFVKNGNIRITCKKESSRHQRTQQAYMSMKSRQDTFGVKDTNLHKPLSASQN